jgi:hypothetical protein
MTLWWIGNIVLLVVVTPVVVLLLRGVLGAALTVRGAVDGIVTVGTKMVTDLEPVPELIKTESYVSQTSAGLSRYGTALDELL